jgi:hypothetical protein
LRVDDLARAEECFTNAAVRAPTESDRRRARAFAELCAAKRSALSSAPPTSLDPAAATAGPLAPAEPALADVALARFNDGTAEGVVQGAALGAAGAFLITAAAQSAARFDKFDALPWLIAGPVIGGAAGAIAALLVIVGFDVDPGDVAIVPSATWIGGITTLAVLIALFHDTTDIRFVPVQYLLALGGGAAGAAAGIAAASIFDITQGDTALANSAALWGGVLTALALAISPNGRDVPGVAGVIALGVSVPYLVVVAAHSKVEINRFATWLIEAGGAGGLLMGGAVLIATNGRVDPPVVMLTSTAIGVGVGTALAIVTDTVLDEAGP